MLRPDAIGFCQYVCFHPNLLDSSTDSTESILLRFFFHLGLWLSLPLCALSRGFDLIFVDTETLRRWFVASKGQSSHSESLASETQM
jgi:hypothetical protein